MTKEEKEEKIEAFNDKWEHKGFEIASWYKGYQLAVPLNTDEIVLLISDIIEYIAVLTEAKEIIEEL